MFRSPSDHPQDVSISEFFCVLRMLVCFKLPEDELKKIETFWSL